MLEPHADAVVRQAPGEVDGPVKRVHDPAVGARPGEAPLLAQDAVVGVAGEDGFADRPLGRRVHLRHEVVVAAFGADVEAALRSRSHDLHGSGRGV